MKNIQKTNIALLKERIRRNYEEYKDEAIEYGGEYIFILSDEIVAVKEVYRYLTDDDFIDEDEAAFLLTLKNPLKALADEWETYKIVENDDFSEFIENFIKQGTEPHTTVTIADGLREKYGEDMPLNTACLLELVTIGKKLLLAMIEAESADDCEFEEFTYDINEDDEDNFIDDDLYGEHDECATKGGGF